MSLRLILPSAHTLVSWLALPSKHWSHPQTWTKHTELPGDVPVGVLEETPRLLQ